MMKYKGYEARVVIEPEHRRFYGDVLHLRTPITFEGTSFDELETAFHDAVDDYLEYCGEEGVEPERPFSGRFVVRVDPEVHKALATIAARSEESLNSVVGRAFDRLIDVELAHGSRESGPVQPKHPGPLQVSIVHQMIKPTNVLLGESEFLNMLFAKSLWTAQSVRTVGAPSKAKGIPGDVAGVGILESVSDAGTPS